MMRGSTFLLVALLALAGCSSLPVAEAPAPAVSPIEAATAAAPAAAASVPVPATAIAAPPPDAVAEAAAEAMRVRRSLWLRIREGLAMPDLDDDRVKKWEDYYAARPEYVARMMDRGGRYLFHVVEEVDARGMPMELALLPFIESAFNPQARSKARAVGMWQFVAATGRDFDLRQNLFRDDRQDVIASTRAALDYLQMLHQQFDDWHLALAAYNWGQGSVLRAIKRNERYHKPTGYDALRMPEETRNYVPKLLAIKHIVQNPEAYGLALPPLENHPVFQAVPIERDIDVALAARLAGLDEDSFREFNPQHVKPVILAASTSEVLLPYDAAQRFEEALKVHEGPMASWTVWVAPKTMTPAQAAKIVGASESDLREVNHIPPRMKVRAGSALVVPRRATHEADVAEHLAENAAMQLVPESGNLRRVVLRVGRKGDSVVGVARRYKLDVDDVARWNGVGSRHIFKAGSKVVVMMPKKGSTRTARGGGGSSASRKPSTRTAKSKR